MVLSKFKRKLGEEEDQEEKKKIPKLDSQNDDVTPTTSFSSQPSTSYAPSLILLMVSYC